MKKFNAVSVLEVTLVLMFVAVTSYFGWQAFTNKSFDLLNLSNVTLSTKNSIETMLTTKKSKLQDLMAYLNSNQKGSSDYNQKRVETTGVIGQLISAYNAAKAAGSSDLDKLKQSVLDAIRDLALSNEGTTSENATETQKEAANKTAAACLANPSACTNLMTVTSMSSTLSGVNPNSIYNGGKIKINLTYQYSYIDNNGNVQTQTVTQTVNIQKEQNTSNVGKTYDSFLPDYIANNFSSTATTGSATTIQDIMNSYTTGTNCILSKSDGQYYDFASQTMYSSKNSYCSSNPTQCN